jgi:hypothetical protein
MGRELGRISGPLLAENLKRNGVDLAFENTLLYFNVTNNYVGINNSGPAYDLDVSTFTNTGGTSTGLTSTDWLIVDNNAFLANLEFTTNNVQNVTGPIVISPNQSSNPTIVVPNLKASDVYFSDNSIKNYTASGDLNLTPTGQIVVNSNTLVNGDLHATGNVTFDGNITFGNAPTDTINFKAEVNSDILPSITNTDSLGSSTLVWKTYYGKITVSTILTSTLDVTSTFTATGTNTYNNNFTVGASSSDTLNIQSTFDSSLIPSNTGTYNLGSNSLYWNNLFVNKIIVKGNTVITDNSIATTNTNSNLVLVANGSGLVRVYQSSLKLDQNATINGNLLVNVNSTLGNTTTKAITQTGDFNQTGNSTISGSLTASGNITIFGANTYLDIGNFDFRGSTVTNTLANADINLLTTGTGNIVIPTSSQFGKNVNLIHNLILSGSTNLQSLVSNNTITQTGDYSQYGNASITGTVVSNNLIFPTTGSYIEVGNFHISRNTIQSITSNSDISFLAAGTGSTNIEKLTITNNNIRNTWTSTSEPLLTQDAQLIVTQDGIILTTEFFSTSISQKSIYLTPTGTGNIFTNTTRSLVLPVGDDLVRSMISNGEIRYNDVWNNYEGFSETGYINFIGLVSQDHLTTVFANGLTETLNFTANTTLTTTIDSTKLFSNALLADSILISSNNIDNTNLSTDLFLSPTDQVNFVNTNIKVNGSTINVDDNTLTFYSTDYGHVRFTGSNGFILPVGSINNRPATPELGTTRYNASSQVPELWNGTEWVQWNGVSAKLTTEEVSDVSYTWALILGL